MAILAKHYDPNLVGGQITITIIPTQTPEKQTLEHPLPGAAT